MVTIRTNNIRLNSNSTSTSSNPDVYFRENSPFDNTPIIDISPTSTHVNTDLIRISIIGTSEVLTGLSAREYIERGIRNGVLRNLHITIGDYDTNTNNINNGNILNNINNIIGHNQFHEQYIGAVQTEETSIIEDYEDYKKKFESNTANKKARLLLLSELDDDNLLRYLHDDDLEINSKLFKDIKYIIPIDDKIRRIKVVKNNNQNNIITELCALLRISDIGLEIPLNDWILAKFLSLEYDEEHFLLTANHWDIKESLKDKLDLIDYIKAPMESQFRWC